MKSRRREDDNAAEVLAQILRLWGRYAFDTELGTSQETAVKLENWAQHILQGSNVDVSNFEQPCSQRRRYAELCAFVERQRQAERHALDTANEEIDGALLKISIHIGALQSEVRRLMGESKDPSLCELVNGLEALDAEVGVLQRRSQMMRGETDQDALTALHSRQNFELTLSNLLANHRSVLCMLIDLDHFSRLNDSYGHSVGDEFLRRVARVLQIAFDGPESYVARFGGEAFAVLLTDVDLNDGSARAEEILEKVRGLSLMQGESQISLTTSIGYVQSFPREQKDALLSRVKRALFSAKRHRDCAVAG